MTSAQAMEEELQQSVILSEEDMAYESADTGMNGSTITAATHSARDKIDGAARTRTRRHATEDLDDEYLSDQDASGEDVDEDAEGEEYDAEAQGQITVAATSGDDDLDEEEAILGAVKVKAEDSDEDDQDSDEATEPSGSGSEEDDESEEDEEEEAPWAEVNGADQDDEDFEAGAINTCMFCKEDEENDPSEDFETFLSCSTCANNSHQQCARDAAAMSERNNANRWKCPDCYSEDSEGESADEQDGEDAESADIRPVSQHSDIPKALLPVQRGKMNPDAHSVFNDLLLEDDPMNGSRLLRKRKTSSIDPNDSIVGLRKKRRRASEDAVSLQDDDSGVTPSRDSARSQSVRTLRLKVTRPPPVTVEKHSRTSMILKMQVKPGNLREVLARKKREKRRGGESAPRSGRPPAGRSHVSDLTPIPLHALPTPFTSDTFSQPFYSFFDKDTEEGKGKPYGGILTEAEADTSRTLPMPDDRRRFEHSKQKAEDEWRARVLAMQAEAEVPIRRPKKISENASQIECIEFGGWEIDTWYAAPYPAEYSRNRVLYICEFCLKYMNSDYVAWRHKLKCATKHPPGDEIYRHGSISIFEVDGRKNPVYCQNLCLLAKLFLGSKTLYYDVEPFLFYVLCEYDDCGYHFVGYFSKEKRASSQNNVSCILTLPIHQRKGYGNLLIDFSYLLTKVEEKTGSPEKPLSDMGLVSYRNYWRLVLCQYLLRVMEDGEDKTRGLSIKTISDDTGMTPDDVIAALEGLRALVRDPQTKLYAFRVDLEYCRQYAAKWESKGYVKLKPEALAWTPYVMGRSNAVNFELGPPINTIAPREDDEAKIEEGPNSLVASGLSVVNGTTASTSEQEAEPSVEEEADGLDEASEVAKSVEKVGSEDKENAEPDDTVIPDAESEGPDAWSRPYTDIPVSRFEVFPAISGRRGGDRTRQSVSRPAIPRMGSSSRRSGGGSARRPKLTRPKASGSRRKSGGTGRGPGRWPKGTKKSDYGNADSGPGLPPGWQDKITQTTKQTLAATVANDQDELMGGGDAEDEPAKDSVQVFVSAPSSLNGHDKGSGNGVNGANGKGLGSITNGGIGAESVDEEDVDAEGEDA